VERDVLLGGLEQLGDFQLAQPDAICLYPEIYPGVAIVGGVNYQAAHAVFPLFVVGSPPVQRRVSMSGMVQLCSTQITIPEQTFIVSM
jgi:hypothetical protein